VLHGIMLLDFASMNACILINNNYLNIVKFNLYAVSCFLLYVCIVFTPVPSDSRLGVIFSKHPKKQRRTSRFYSPYHVHYPLHHLSDDILWPLYDEMKLYEIPVHYEPSTRKHTVLIPQLQCKCLAVTIECGNDVNLMCGKTQLACGIWAAGVLWHLRGRSVTHLLQTGIIL
jgi:hypothetical protein